jgi:cyclophilin family peptidyl-prolyl cis-trans isomerase
MCIGAAVAGLVSMARGLDGTVDSRFFVTLPSDARWADGRYVAFGRLGQSDGSMEVLDNAHILMLTFPALVISNSLLWIVFSDPQENIWIRNHRHEKYSERASQNHQLWDL